MLFSPLRSLLLVACVLAGLISSAQQLIPTRGKEFWFGFMENYTNSVNPHLYVYISSDVNTSGTMSSPVGWEQPFNVTANTVTQLEVPLDNEHLTSGIVENKSVLIVTEDTVAVYALNFEGATADATVIYPTPSLGTDYFVQAYSGLAGDVNLVSELLIVATADGTQMEITPACLTMDGQLPGVPYTISLNTGESYQVQASVGDDDVTGTRVRATELSGACRPFAVFSGSVCANVPITCTYCDHVYEQNLPTPFWGSSYYSVPFEDSDGYTYRLIARQDGTQITVDNGPPVNLNAGDYVEVNNTAEPHCFAGNLPFSVSQLMEGSTCSGGLSDPALLILNADEQKINDITFATVVSQAITDQYINVVVDITDVSSVVLNGTPVSSGQFTPFVSCSDRAYATLPLTQGSHRISCVNGLTGYVYGTGPGFETYAYSVGSYSPYDALAFDTAFCVNDVNDPVTLNAPFPVFNPAWTAQSNPQDTLWEGLSYTFQPTASDVYILNGTIDGSGCIQQVFYSVEIIDPPATSISAPLTVCAYTPVQLDLTLTPNGTYLYDWGPDAGLDNDNAQDPTLTPIHSGWYHVDVSSLTGCSTTEDSVFVEVTDGTVLGTQATADPALLCIGGQSQLGVAVQRIIARDGFNNVIGTMWEEVLGGAPSALCGAVEGQALRFNDAGFRYAKSLPLDLTDGGTLSFAIKLATGTAPCDDVDLGENILVEYSINNASWVIMANYAASQFPEFTTMTLPVPVGAQTASTRFRWRQLLNSGVDQDNWMLDDVAIASVDDTGIDFTWSPAGSLSNALVNDPMASPPASQVYTVSMVDASTGCSYSDEVEVEIGPLFALELSNDTAICGSFLPVTLSAVPLVNGVYTWAWSPNDGSLSNTDQSQTTAIPGATTEYIVAVSNQFGCTVVDTVIVSVVQALSLSAVAVPAEICQGSPSQLQVQVFQGSGNYAYQWSPAAWLSDATIPDPVATPQTSTTYTVLVTDLGCGASAFTTAFVSVLPAPPIDLGPDQPLCDGTAITLTASAAQSWLWSTSAVTQSIIVDEPGTYSVQGFTADCISVDTVVINPAPDPGELDNTVFGCLGSPVQLFIPYFGGTYLWATGDTTRGIVVSVAGDYAFTLIDQYGCDHTGIVTLEADPLSGGLVVPNVITPNGDGLNEVFAPLSGGNPAVAVSIYNRFGQEVFSAENMNTLWSGRKNGDALPDGTYFYVVRYKAACAVEAEEQKGAVMLVR